MVCLIVGKLCLLLKQRTAVPELVKDRWHIWFMLINTIIAFFTIAGLVNEKGTFKLPELLCMSYGSLLVLYMSACLFFCTASLSMLRKLKSHGMPVSTVVVDLKTYLVYLMGFQILCCNNSLR